MNNPENIKHKKRVTRNNKIASYVISAGGFGIILSIAAILLFLVYKSYPLSSDANLEKISTASSGKNKVILMGMDRFQEINYSIFENGEISFSSNSSRKVFSVKNIDLEENERIIFADKGSLRNETFALITNLNRIITAEIKMTAKYQNDKRQIVPSLEIIEEFKADSSGFSIKNFIFTFNENSDRIYSWTDSGNNLNLRIFGFDDEEIFQHNLSGFMNSDEIKSCAVNHSGEVLICGTKTGELFWFDISDFEEPELIDNWKAGESEITALEFLLGDNSLVTGDLKGFVSVWFPVRNSEGVQKFTRIHEFEKHQNPVEKIFVSSRNRTFITIDAGGEIILNHSTTSHTSLKFRQSQKKVVSASFSPKSDAILVAGEDNNTGIYALDDKHPEVSFKTLFSKVWYEGYPEPDFVWQSTGGSDEFEPKMSLIPLIFGTLKGTFYAMIFSIPLAILAAIYVSQFAPKKFALIVKPTVEIMAALPSVVIGFLAGLYFSPLFEKNLMFLFFFTAILPVFFLFAIISWKYIPEEKKVKLPGGSEMLYVIPFAVMAFIAASFLSIPIENTFFGGNINQWFYEVLDTKYDQRNSLVVGFALGFAVIPIIFTISEDALSNVPKSLTSAALALGASRWQTVKRIVVPAAAGGIFSAIMLGLGRAIGETMIVLMATGNTPILEMNPFNGFRAMSATIAVEIPEAPVDGSLYRVLFLTALLLFVFTFIINSLAAVIGDKLRKKYARF